MIKKNNNIKQLYSKELKQKRDFYQTREWKSTRKEFISNSDRLCNRCKLQKIFSIGTVVHHIKPITIYNLYDKTITLNPNNLELLCRDCHEEEHNRTGSELSKEYMIDNKGNVVLKQISKK